MTGVQCALPIYFMIFSNRHARIEVRGVAFEFREPPRGETGGEHGWRGLRGWEGGTVRERKRRFILLAAGAGTVRIIPGPQRIAGR